MANKQSPYKQIKSQNQHYVTYTNMSKLVKNKAYLIYELQHTEHDKYGAGELAFMRGKGNERVKTQLPTKYLKSLGDGIQDFKDDINLKKFPFLVFRDQLTDGSYVMEILEFSTDLLNKNKTWEDVEIQSSPNSSLDSLDKFMASFDDKDAESKKRKDHSDDEEPDNSKRPKTNK